MLFFISGAYIFYILFSFSYYIESKIPEQIPEFRKAMKDGYYHSTENDGNNGYYRNVIGKSIKFLLEIADQKNNNIVKFTQIVVQDNPTNAIRLTPVLQNIQKVQEYYLKNENISYNEIIKKLKQDNTINTSSMWRQEKQQLYSDILDNKRNRLICFYTNDSFSKMKEEDKAQKKEMSTFVNKYKNLNLIKIEKLPIEKGMYMIFKVKEYLFFTKYYIFLVDCGQDDQLEPIKSHINIKYQKASNIDNISNVNLKRAVMISEGYENK